jgi:hypothetical protein
MARITLSPQWRRALEMLADAGETGVPVATLLASGFSIETLQSLEMVGLAVRFTGQRALHITNAGRLALGARNTPALAPGTPAPQAANSCDQDCASRPEETAARIVGPPDGTTRS